MKKVLLFPIILLFQTTLFAAPAPDFTVTTSDGQTRKLYQDYVNQGKLVLLEIFFTTCPPCAGHAPHLQALYQSMLAIHPGTVEFMLLSDRQADNDSLVNAYLTSKGLTMPAAGSAGGSLAAVQPYESSMFGPFIATPTFVIIKPGTGEVIFDIRGNSPQETMELIEQQINSIVPTVQDCFLKSYFDNPVPDVQIKVKSPLFDTTFMASGAYSVSAITELQNASYTITPFKGDAPLQGISTWDLVLMSKHILGLDPFTEPWQLIAADLNCSGTISTFDIIEGRKLILGITNGLSGCAGATWQFVPDPYGPTANGACLNFRGVKLGDLTGPYFAPEDPVDDRERTRLGIEDRRIERGQTYRVALRARSDLRLTGIQLSFGIDPAALRIRGIESLALQGFDEQHYNLELQRTEGYVPVSWQNAERPAEIRAEESILVLSVEALQSALLSDVLGLRAHLRAEAYEASGENRPLELEWTEIPAPTPTNTFSVSPNPARDVVDVSFRTEQDETVRLQIIDAQGKIVLEQRFDTVKGWNRLELRPDAPLSGLHFVKIGGETAGKVMFSGKR